MEIQKLRILGEASQYDLCNYVSLNQENFTSKNLPGIYHARTQSGCQVPLFKTLMSNHCINDCNYCINHCHNKFERIEFSPDELISVFLHYYQNHYAEGLFLSSGMPGDADRVMENMLEVARKLRLEHEYQGYIHLKIIPGASYDMIKRAMNLADRVSVNIESATSSGFDELTSTKDYYNDVLRRMKWIGRLKKRHPEMAPSGQSTQLIVGANDETDQDILKRAEWLHKHLDINLSYLSPFQPLEDTPLENHTQPENKRTPRLYQAQFLLNSYGFSSDELLLDEEGFLFLDEDPKYLWAKSHPDMFPLEVNEAGFKELLRVPGIGKKSARRIIESRRNGMKFRHLDELKKIGVVVKRAEPFIQLERAHQTTLPF
ncbi:radical SAM protein [Methanobacterium ferruginis]|uniref:radical SAM protein n=1 Tax=Methanobacterium ferruginis TaxID=710191 RepID=UPI0033067BF2|nr:radical SAM protein [Methanobacterium ferruginis]